MKIGENWWKLEKIGENRRKLVKIGELLRKLGKIGEQAGAELGQAQIKLELGFNLIKI